MPLLALELNCSAATALVKKWMDAMKGVRELKEAYEGLNESMDEETLKWWKEEEAEAMENRGNLMRSSSTKVGVLSSNWIVRCPKRTLAPTMAEIRLALREKEDSNSLESGTIAWLTTGVNLEQMQCVPLNIM